MTSQATVRRHTLVASFTAYPRFIAMPSATAIVQTRHDSPLGRLLLAATETRLVGLWFDGQRHPPDPSAWPEAPEHPVLHQAKAQLDEYFSSARTAFELPLDLGTGTTFQQRVWRLLLTIPHGTTGSYGDLSAILGQPTAARAFGSAVGRNPLSIIVPCHRVLGAGNRLTGYAGGLERKLFLLQHEGSL